MFLRGTPPGRFCEGLNVCNAESDPLEPEAIAGATSGIIGKPYGGMGPPPAPAAGFHGTFVRAALPNGVPIGGTEPP